MAQDFTDNRLGEHLKIDLNASLQAMATGRAADQVFLQGKKYPCTVAQVISPGIVKINFEVNAAPFTLPQMTVPVVGSEYMRQPIQVGDKGMCIAADVRLGGITGLGTGVPDLTAPGNLSGLAFHWLGNVAWPTQNDLSLPIDPTAVSFYSALSCVTSVGSAGVIVSGSHANLTVNGVSNLLGGSNTITMPIGDSSLNIATTAFVTGSISRPGSGFLPLSGGTLTGDLIIRDQTPALRLNVIPGGTSPTNQPQIFGQNNGVNRWAIVAPNNEAETGSDAGSNFVIWSCTDAGAYKNSVLSLNRATGNVTFSNLIQTNGTGTNLFNGQLQINMGGTANSVPIAAYQSALPAGGTMYFATGGTGWGGYNNAGVLFYNAGSGSQSNQAILTVLGGSGFTINGYGNCTIPNQLQIGGGGYLYMGTGGGAKIQFDGSVGNDGSGSTLKIDIYGSGPGTYGIGLSGSNQYYLSNGTHNFWSAGTRVLSIASNGVATFSGYVNVTRPPAGVDAAVQGYYQGGSYYNAETAFLATSGSSGILGYNNSSNNFWFSGSGSDRRMKSNIRDVERDALAIVKALPIHAVDYNPPKPSREKRPGAADLIADGFVDPPPESWPFSFIADEVDAVMPHAVIHHTEDDGVDYSVGVHPLHLCSVLWRAVQQLTEQNEALSTRVAALEARA